MKFNEDELYEKLGLQTQTAGFDTTNTLYMKALQLTRSERRAEDLLMHTITDIFEKGIKLSLKKAENADLKLVVVNGKVSWASGDPPQAPFSRCQY